MTEHKIQFECVKYEDPWRECADHGCIKENPDLGIGSFCIHLRAFPVKVIK